MKFFLALFFMSFSAIAEVTPEQMNSIFRDTEDVMLELGADVRLRPRILSIGVASTLGSRAKIRFTYREDYYGIKKCTYYYDLSVMAPVKNSALCGL